MRRRLLLGVGVAMAAGAAALLAGPAGVVSAALGGLGVWLWLCSTRRAADPEAAWARSVLDALGQGVVRLDARHCVTYANPAAAALVGYDAAALLGQPFAMVLLPEDFPQWLQALTQAPAGAAYHYEARLRRPDGQWRPARLICQPGGRATQPGETVITLTDLTEPRQAETHSRLLAAGVEAMPVGLLLTDRQGRVVYSNPAVSALTGYTAAELRGQSMRLLKSGWQSPALYEALWAALLAGQVWRGELVNRRQDGRLYTQESVLVPVRADGDIITHFAALVQDISQRQQSEADLRANEAKYRLLVENSSDGITMTDEQGRVVEWSVAQEAITGLGRPAALGRPLWELMDDLALPERRTPESRAQLRAGVMQVLSTGQMPWAYEYRTLEIWRPEGTRRTVEAVAYPIQTETGWLLCAIMRDVTDRLQAETAIRQLNQALEQRVLERTHQLEAANQALEAERAQLAARVAARTADLSAANAELARAARAKDEFLASMSHELRTPLNTVLGLAEVLQEGGFGALAPEQADAVAGIEESGRHLLAVINDILDLSKIEAGQLQLQLEPVDVAAVCQASVRLIRETAQRNGLSVTVAVDPAAAEVLADERRLKQMLVNLLSNACKFTPAGGSLGLAVTPDLAGESLSFTVWDTGIGIAPEDHPRLFQPFVQLDSRLAREYTGTGLGLALVRRMAEAHGGGVALESAAGAGSRFTVRLPWRRPAADPAAAAAAELAPAASWFTGAAGERPLVILLADDNEANLQVFARYLDGCHRRLVVARTGLEVLARAAELRPDVVILDVQLPELDGLEAARRLRATAGLRHVPIIVVTALAMAGDRERCLAAGADAYLSKPVSFQALRAAIDAQLNRPARRGGCGDDAE